MEERECRIMNMEQSKEALRNQRQCDGRRLLEENEY
jgi:hypothetical protein